MASNPDTCSVYGHRSDPEGLFQTLPLSRAIEQTVTLESSGEITQPSLHWHLPLEGIPSQVPSSTSCGLKRKSQTGDALDVFDRYSQLYARNMISNDSLNTTFVLNENLSHGWTNITSTRKSLGKEIILDFEQSAVRLASNERDLERVLLKPRHVRDDRYGCLFQQSGSVETQGQSFGAGDEAHTVNVVLNANSQGFLLTTASGTVSGLQIRLYNADGAHGYELPTSNTLGAIVFDNGVTGGTEFDVMWEAVLADYSCYFKRGEQVDGFHDVGEDSVSKIQEPEDVDRLISVELPDPQTDPQGYKVVSEMMIHGPCGAVNMSATYIDTGVSTMKHQVRLDNSYVVSYNSDLLLAFEAHINVEYCGLSMLIKYLFKYISKGTDRILALVSKPLGESSNGVGPSRPPIDEIQNYLEGRFVCPHEALWRILKFDIHCREPAVQILSVHLEGMQRVTFRDIDRLESVVNLPGRKSTMLTEWLAYNEANEDEMHLTYLDFPSEFVWYDDRKSWSPCRNSRSSIGRLAYVHPTSGELFYFRMLLCHQKGCRDFLEVQTVHDIFYPTCRAACEALGLLRDDNECDIAMQEACASTTSSELRFVFAHILTHCEVFDPLKLWTKYWKEMSHDIPGRVSEMTHIPNYHLNDDSLQGYILYELEIILNNCGKSLQHFGLGPPPPGLSDMLANRFLIEERNYNQEELNQQELIFVYGHGGTGRTAHSRFKLPIELTKESLCKVTKNSQLGKLLADTDLIICDEAPMNDRRCFEALDRSLRDILMMPNRLFGGKSILLGGDFRQTLPVKKGASKIEIIASPGVSADESNLISSFASWLLDIGDGRIGEPDQEDPENTNWIDIPVTYRLPDNEQGLSKLIDFIYDQMTLGTPSAITLSTTSMELSTFAELTSNSHDKIIEARVYRKWIGKSLPDLIPNALCCILLDREGTNIQANMSLKDIDYSTRSWKWD
ncbi:DNA helicase [Tanacetum coccineum]